MKYISINQTGLAHRNGECEDAIYINPDKTVFCLADGVSNSKYGAIGAKQLVNSLGKHFGTSECKNLLFNGTVDEVRTEICSIINHSLKELCEKSGESNIEVFASTFLALVKTDANDIALIHAGDGAIFGQPRTTQKSFATILSYPDNTPDGKVYSAGNPEQISRMRVLRIRSTDYDSIMLCTDGFSEAYLVPSFQAYDIDSISDAFRVKNNEELSALVNREHIYKRNISDDISCIICKAGVPVSDHSGKKTYINEAKGISINDASKGTTKGKNTSVNQIEYVSHSKNRKSNAVSVHAKGYNGLIVAFSVLSIIISIIACVYIKEINKTNTNRDREISSLQEQISIIDKKLNEAESESALITQSESLTAIEQIDTVETSSSDYSINSETQTTENTSAQEG